MQKLVLIASIFFLTSCGMTTNHADKKPSAITDTTSVLIATKTYSLKDKTVKFLWCVKKQNGSLRDSTKQ